MSVHYQAVGWNRQKRRYDALALGGVLGFLAIFIGVSAVTHPSYTAETLLIRGLGSAAFVLLHIILSIGPLCRLDPCFLPLLYNRRHIGVLMACLGLGHGAFAILQFHGFGDLNPLVSLLVSNTRWDSLAQLPFQQLGAAALLILVLMAATSHDFWLSVLSAPVWKALHMAVYAAWGLLVAHVTLGALQSERSGAISAVVGLGVLWVIGLHLLAARKEKAADQAASRAPGAEGFVEVLGVDEIPEARARTVCLSGDRVAVFRYEGKVSAVSNACRHQNGPLGEGRVIDGCITCPWHGYQYKPETGASPPPFTETVPTFRVRVVEGRVWLHPTPLPAGSFVEPARVEGEGKAAADGDFYVGYFANMAPGLARLLRPRLGLLYAVVAAIAVIFAVTQGPPRATRFEYGTLRAYEGRVELWPHPVLLVDRPGAAMPATWLLVDPFKHGADARFADLGGHRVAVSGTLAWSEDQSLLEVDPDSVRDLGPSAERITPVALGQHTLRGEIVDSKCYLGVMNPGESKVHRDCAVRCISGGIPPSFLVHDGPRDRAILLVGAGGEAIGSQVLDLVAEPLQITGRLEQRGELYLLYADPAAFKRI